MSNSSDFLLGSKKYSTDTYERKYLGSTCLKRKWLVCKQYEYKYKDRNRSTYEVYEDDENKPIKVYVPDVYKNVDDYSKPIYKASEYTYASSKKLISLDAKVSGITNGAVYTDAVKINWTDNKYNVFYTAKLNGEEINRNKVVSDDGVYLLDITGKNKLGEEYTRTMLFAINKDQNNFVLDYYDECGYVTYREIVNSYDQSLVEIVDEKLMFKNYTNRGLNGSIEKNAEYIHSRLADMNNEGNSVAPLSFSLIAGSIIGVAGIVIIGAVVLTGLAGSLDGVGDYSVENPNADFIGDLNQDDKYIDLIGDGPLKDLLRGIIVGISTLPLWLKDLFNSKMETTEQEIADVNSFEGTLQDAKETITEEQKAEIKEKTGWSDDVVNSFRSMEEAQIYMDQGLIETVVSGKICLVNPNIDWNLKDAAGISNLERALDGYSPKDANGKKIELHHVGQHADSPLAELPRVQHRGPENDTKLHDKTKKSEIDRGKFDTEREEHWKSRAREQE